MNPISKKIINKLSQEDKTELKTEKVELGIVQDFNKIASRLKSGNSTLNKAAQNFVDDLSNFGKLRNKLDSSFGRAETFANQIEDDLKEIQDKADEIAVKAKELGVAPKDLGIDISIVKNIDDIEDTIKSIRRNSSDAKKIINVI